MASAESQLRLTEEVESQFTLTEEAVPTPDISPESEPEADFPELQQAENAAAILFSHVNPMKSAHVQEAMRCLSAAHDALGQSLAGKAAQIKELQANLDRA